MPSNFIRKSKTQYIFIFIRISCEQAKAKVNLDTLQRRRLNISKDFFLNIKTLRNRVTIWASEAPGE